MAERYQMVSDARAQGAPACKRETEDALRNLPRGMLEIKDHALLTFIRPLDQSHHQEITRLYLDVALLCVWNVLSDHNITIEQHMRHSADMLALFHGMMAELHDGYHTYGMFNQMYESLDHGQVVIRSLGSEAGLRHPDGLSMCVIIGLASNFDSVDTRRMFFMAALKYGACLCSPAFLGDGFSDEAWRTGGYEFSATVKAAKWILDSPERVDPAVRIRLTEAVYAVLTDYYKSPGPAYGKRTIDFSVVTDAVALEYEPESFESLFPLDVRAELLDLRSELSQYKAFDECGGMSCLKITVVDMVVRSITNGLNRTLFMQGSTRFGVADWPAAVHSQICKPHMMNVDSDLAMYWHPIEGLKRAAGEEQKAQLLELFRKDLKKPGDLISGTHPLNMFVPKQRFFELQKRDTAPTDVTSFCHPKHRHPTFKLLDPPPPRPKKPKPSPQAKAISPEEQLKIDAVAERREKAADKKRRAIISALVSRAVFEMPCMRLARERRLTLQAAIERARLRSREHRGKFAILRALVQQQIDRDRDVANEDLITRLRARNAHVRNGVAARSEAARDRDRWYKAERAREKADRLAAQHRKAEEEERAARDQADRLRKARWAAEREAQRAHSKASNSSAPKLSARNIGKLSIRPGANTSTDDDSSSVAASQAVSMAPSYNPTFRLAPRETHHSRSRVDERKPTGMSDAAWRAAKIACLTSPDRKFVKHDAYTGEPTTVVQKGDLKLYLDRDGLVIKTVAWANSKHRDSDESSVTSEAGPSSSSASPLLHTPPPQPALAPGGVIDLLEQRQMEEAIRRSLEQM